jgi:hypothetical protein
MVLPDIKQLEKLLKLLRAQGVMQYQTTDLNLVLSETAPVDIKAKSLAEETMEELSPEEEVERLLFYSATPPIDSKES